MTVNVEELVVKFSADITGLRTNLERVEKSFKNVDKTVAATSGKMSAQIGGLGRLFKLDLVMRYGSQLLALENRMEELASTIKDTSDRADLSAESLQRLRHVADQNGTSAEAMDSALIRLNKAMGLARLGAEGMGEMFDALGLGDLIKQGASTEDVFFGIADAVRSMTDESQASAVVSKIMGREADRLIETFKLGGDEAERLGNTLRGVIPQETIDKLDAARDRTEEYRKTINALGAGASTVFVDLVLLISAVAREIENLLGPAQAVIDLYNSVKDFGSGNLAQSFGAAPTAAGQVTGQLQAPARGQTKSPSRSFTPGKVDEGALRTLLGGGSGSGSGGGMDAAAQAAERYREAIADLNFEIAQLALSEQDAAFQEELRNRLTAAGVVLESEHGEAIRQKVEELQAATAAGEELAAAWAVEAANANREIAAMHDEMMKAANEWDQFTGRAGDALADAMVEAALNFENAKEILAELVVEIGKAIAKMLILKAIEAGINAVFGGGGGILGGSAGGGYIGPGGPRLVGEQGPELFMPAAPGRIIPNNRLGGGGNVISINSVVNASGGVNKAELEMVLNRRDQNLVRLIPKIVGDKNARGALKLS